MSFSVYTAMVWMSSSRADEMMRVAISPLPLSSDHVRTCAASGFIYLLATSSRLIGRAPGIVVQCQAIDRV